MRALKYETYSTELQINKIIRKVFAFGVQYVNLFEVGSFNINLRCIGVIAIRVLVVFVF